MPKSMKPVAITPKSRYLMPASIWKKDPVAVLRMGTMI